MVKKYQLRKHKNISILELEKEEGAKAKAIEIAGKMLNRGRPLKEIEEDTGLTKKEIGTLKKILYKAGSVEQPPKVFILR